MLLLGTSGVIVSLVAGSEWLEEGKEGMSLMEPLRRMLLLGTGVFTSLSDLLEEGLLEEGMSLMEPLRRIPLLGTAGAKSIAVMLEEGMSLMEPLRRIPLLGTAGVISSMERMEEGLEG